MVCCTSAAPLYTFMAWWTRKTFTAPSALVKADGFSDNKDDEQKTNYASERDLETRISNTI